MRGRGLVALAVLAAGAAGGLGAGLLKPGAGSAGADRADPLGRAAAGLGRGPRPAFVPGRPALLAHGETAYRWAPVVHPATARGAPGSGAPVAALDARTPEGTTNLVLVLGASRRRGSQWVHVRLPVLPNDSTGWVPRSALGGYHFVRTHLVVDLERLRATLYRDGRAVFRAPVGTGQPQSPTPPGEFYIRDKLTDYASPFYGPVAFGTSARSTVLTDWPDGGYVGIHGTDAPGLIPGRVSHGCIRLRDGDIVRLARLMPVGTPLTVR
jgi:hypothetical protein